MRLSSPIQINHFAVSSDSCWTRAGELLLLDRPICCASCERGNLIGSPAASCPQGAGAVLAPTTAT